MLEDIRNFLPLTDKLLTGGMPSADQVAAASRSGVQMVINLATLEPENDLRDEAVLVRSLGMDYLHIPVDWEAPTQQDLADFMDAMAANRDKKLLVHCRANYRATAFVALYGVLRLGWKQADALSDLRRIWDPDEYPVWAKFIAKSLASEP